MRVLDLFFFQKPIFLYKKHLFRIYTSACLQYLLEEPPFDSFPPHPNPPILQNRVEIASPDENPKPRLYPLLSRVFHTLSWKVARRVRFTEAVDRYGLAHSVHIFSTIAHIYSSAGMDQEVHAILMDIVCNHNKFDYNGCARTFELFRALLDLSSRSERPGAVFGVLMKVYARSKMVENAVSVFELVKGVGIEPDVKSCNFLLKCLVEGNRSELVTSLFDEMKRSGPRPNEYTYTIVMQCYCGEKIQIGRATEILDEMEKCGLNPTTVTFGIYVSALCKSGNVVTALHILEALSRNQFLSTNSYNAVICGLCCEGEIDKAREAINDMRGWGVPLDVHSYSKLIAELCKKGKITEASDLLLEMKSNGIKPFIVTINLVLHGLCKSGGVGEALTVMEEMQSLGVSLNEHSYNILIDGICKIGRIEDSRLVEMKMKSDGIEPSIVSISPRLDGLCKSGKMDDALREFCTIEKHDVISYGIMINGYCKHGNVDAAHKLMEIMMEKKLEPDVRIYNSLLQTMSLQEAQKFMLDNCTLPNTYTCTIMVDKFCKEGSLEEAWLFMYTQQDKGIYPNLYTYNTIINGLCKQGKTKDAEKIICTMLKRILYPDAVIYSTIIDGFTKESNLDEALNWYEMMLKHRIESNVFTCTSLIGRLLSCRRTIEASTLLKQIVVDKLVDKVSYTAIIAGFCKIGDMKMAVGFYHKMIHGNVFVPDVVTYTAIIHGFSKIKLGDMEMTWVFEMEKLRIITHRGI